MAIFDCVPVLMYHHVNNNKGDLYTISPDIFEEQMYFLYANGYETVTCDNLLDFMTKGRELKRSIMLTFDDGWLDNYVYAIPVLNKYGLMANFFIVPKWIDQATSVSSKAPSVFPGHEEAKANVEHGNGCKVVFNWRIVQEMNNSGLADFQSHTYTHARCSDLGRKELISELVNSKKAIENNLNKKCSYLSWPWGSYNSASVQIADQCGYKGLFTSHGGVATPKSNPLSVNRIDVIDSAEWFEKTVRYNTNLLSSSIYINFAKVLDKSRAVWGSH